MLGVLVEVDIIAIGEVIFWCKSIGRIDEESCHKTEHHNGYDPTPQWNAPPQCWNKHDNDQRNHWKHVSRQYSATDHCHGDYINCGNREKSELDVECNSLSFALRIELSWAPHRQSPSRC